MAEVNAKDLTTKTAPASTDSMLLFGTSTNEGAKITVDNLANNILERLTTKTFANQVGGSSADTILAQLATLNSNTKTQTQSVLLNKFAVYAKAGNPPATTTFEITGHTGLLIIGFRYFAYHKCSNDDTDDETIYFCDNRANKQTDGFTVTRETGNLNRITVTEKSAWRPLLIIPSTPINVISAS